MRSLLIIFLSSIFILGHVVHVVSGNDDNNDAIMLTNQNLRRRLLASTVTTITSEGRDDESFVVVTTTMDNGDSVSGNNNNRLLLLLLPQRLPQRFLQWQPQEKDEKGGQPVSKELIIFAFFVGITLALFCIFKCAFWKWGGKSTNPAASLRIDHPGL